MSKKYLSISGSIIFIMGLCHGLGTMWDFFAPTFFTPVQLDVRFAMSDTSVALATMFKGNSNFWKAWLGFNLSHSLGACIFGALCFILARKHFTLVEQSRPLRIGLLSVFSLYLLMSVMFWFYLPTIGISLALFFCFKSMVALEKRPASDM